MAAHNNLHSLINSHQMRRAIFFILILLSIAATVWTFRFVNQVAGIPREAYASDWTATFIIEHIRTSGTWPTNWQDLRDEYDRLAVPEHYAWTFEELQSLVTINWDSTIDEIRESPVALDNIQLTSGRQASYNGDPDKLIYDFLRTGNDPNQVHERVGVHRERRTDNGKSSDD